MWPNGRSSAAGGTRRTSVRSSAADGSMPSVEHEQQLIYVPVTRIFRRAGTYDAFFAEYPLSAAGGQRIRRRAVVTVPMLVHEQIGMTLWQLETYEHFQHKEAMVQIQQCIRRALPTACLPLGSRAPCLLARAPSVARFCPGLPHDYLLVGAKPWRSPFKQPHTFLAWTFNLTVRGPRASCPHPMHTHAALCDARPLPERGRSLCCSSCSSSSTSSRLATRWTPSPFGTRGWAACSWTR